MLAATVATPSARCATPRLPGISQTGRGSYLSAGSLADRQYGNNATPRTCATIAAIAARKGIEVRPLSRCRGGGHARAQSDDRCRRDDMSEDSATTPKVLDRLIVEDASASSAKQFRKLPNGHVYIGALRGGEPHGRGRYTWPDGCTYEGNFAAGKMMGKGERTWPSGQRYVGEWREDMMWGNGRLTRPDGEIYEGQFRKGLFHGRGDRLYPNGDHYEGSFVDGLQEGVGTFQTADGFCTLSGLWLHGRMYGEGRAELPDGSSYIGEWRDNIREGNGRLVWPDGSFYEGPFKDNKLHGFGRKVNADGSMFVGHFVDDEAEGHGTFIYMDGSECEANWSHGRVVGPGVLRFPDGVEICREFEGHGTTGRGTKRYRNDCVFQGELLQSKIGNYGTFTWPDGRCYTGQFHDDAMHGEGTLVWLDSNGGACTYNGQFRSNKFEGRGTLDWASGARYEGDFLKGAYHGEGAFVWPGGFSVYSGQWADGNFMGEGTLRVREGKCLSHADLGSYVYIGQFQKGHMHGQGHACFYDNDNFADSDSTSVSLVQFVRSTKVSTQMPSWPCDEYYGAFVASRFHGLGVFTWAEAGLKLSGLFEDNFCNRVGRKVYSDGRVYTGELRHDVEHGKGVLYEAGKCFVGLWENGRVVKKLLMSAEPELELHVVRGGSVTKEMTKFDDAMGRSRGRTPLLPVHDADGALVDGKAVVDFLNHDRYVGRMRKGRKHGLGMYVYADKVTYKGVWIEDALNGVIHPVTEASLPIEVLMLQDEFRDRGTRMDCEELRLTSKESLTPRRARHPLINQALIAEENESECGDRLEDSDEQLRDISRIASSL